MHRKSERKAKSARAFNKASKKTHKRNVQVMRGGFRL